MNRKTSAQNAQIVFCSIPVDACKLPFVFGNVEIFGGRNIATTSTEHKEEEKCKMGKQAKTKCRFSQQSKREVPNTAGLCYGVYASGLIRELLWIASCMWAPAQAVFQQIGTLSLCGFACLGRPDSAAVCGKK